LEFLYIEQNSILKFKNEFELIINRIVKRKVEIENLKKLIKEYENNKNLEKNVENDINNIKNSLKLIRLYTINLVSQIKKFYLVNSHLTSSGKIEFNKIKVNKYNFDYNYFSKIKEDLYFLKNSFINNNLFNFNEIENDLFLLTISDISEFNKTKNEKPNYEILPISDEMYRQVLKLTYFLNQMKIYEKMNNKNEVKEIPKKSDNNSFINTNNNYNNYLNNWLTLNNEINLGVNYKGNINKIINQLKNKNNYDEIFLKSIPNIDSYNQKKNNEKKSSSKTNIKDEIRITTAEELQKKFKEYEKIKQFIEHDTQKNSFQ
jgi:ribosomal protein L18E